MNRKILITGASSGIGAATALHLAQKGHQVLMAARRVDRLKEMAVSSPSVVGEFLVAELDVSKRESIAKFVQDHAGFLQELDVLVNNAGLALGRETLQDSKLEEIYQVVNTNVLGLLALTREVLPGMVKRGRGHVVNLGSVAGITAYQGGAVYCATKAAVHMITDALRIDLGGTGVRVTTVAPGRVATEFSTVRFRGDADYAAKLYQGYEPLSPEDVAETIAWVIERPAHVNIQEIVLTCTEQVNATTVVPKAR